MVEHPKSPSWSSRVRLVDALHQFLQDNICSKNPIKPMNLYIWLEFVYFHLCRWQKFCSICIDDMKHV